MRVPDTTCKQDRAIQTLIADDPEGLRLLISENSAPADGNGCVEWTGRTDGNGNGVISHDGMLLQAHRVVYALERGFGALPSGNNTHLSKNAPCVARTCLNSSCVAPRHLARMRYAHVRPFDKDGKTEPLYCNDEFLPDTYRFRAENIRRRGEVPQPHYYRLDRDSHAAQMVGLKVTPMEDVRDRFEGDSAA